MQHRPRFRGHWPVGFAHTAAFVQLELTDDVEPVVFRRIMAAIFGQFPRMYLSQYVDRRHWDTIPSGEMAQELVDRFGLHVFVTSAYNSMEPVRPASLEYVVHAMGTPQSSWIDSLAHFGTKNLAHIAYAMDSTEDPSQAELFRWNDVIWRLFQLKIGTDDEEFLNLLRERRIIALAIDGHSVLLMTELTVLDTLLKFVEDEARRAGRVLLLAPAQPAEGRRA